MTSSLSDISFGREQRTLTLLVSLLVVARASNNKNAHTVNNHFFEFFKNDRDLQVMMKRL